MKGLVASLAAAAALAAAAPAPAAAQSAADWWEWALPRIIGAEGIRTSRGTVIIPGRDRDRDRRRDRRDDRYDDIVRRGGDRGVRGAGPPFCRNGQGHPVHGRRWCLDKGFGLGSRGYDPVWRRGSWEDIIFRSPRRYYEYDTLRRGSLIDLLGHVVFGRLERHGARYGGGPILGRWVHPARGGAVLQLSVGGIPLAELTDLDRDGRVDHMLVNGR